MFRFPAFLNGPLRRTRTLYYLAQTPVWSESSVDEHNLYFARSAIIGYLVVETWWFKTELIIITILHIINITTSILNLGFKTFAPKILAHTSCINRYWKYTQILAAKNQSKTYCKNKNWAELTAKSLNIGARLIIIYTQNVRFQSKVYAHISKYLRISKYSLPIKIYAHILKYLRIPQIFAYMKNIRIHPKCSRSWNIRAYEIFAPMKYSRP